MGVSNSSFFQIPWANLDFGFQLRPECVGIQLIVLLYCLISYLVRVQWWAQNRLAAILLGIQAVLLILLLGQSSLNAALLLMLSCSTVERLFSTLWNSPGHSRSIRQYLPTALAVSDLMLWMAWLLGNGSAHQEVIFLLLTCAVWIRSTSRRTHFFESDFFVYSRVIIPTVFVGAWGVWTVRVFSSVVLENQLAILLLLGMGVSYELVQILRAKTRYQLIDRTGALFRWLALFGFISSEIFQGAVGYLIVLSSIVLVQIVWTSSQKIVSSKQSSQLVLKWLALFALFGAPATLSYLGFQQLFLAVHSNPELLLFTIVFSSGILVWVWSKSLLDERLKWGVLQAQETQLETTLFEKIAPWTWLSLLVTAALLSPIWLDRVSESISASGADIVGSSK
jgi:hypothetical protein